MATPTTLTTRKHTTHHLHMPVEAPRKTAAALVVLLGAAMLVMTFANNLFKVGPAFESLIDDFRPHLEQTAIDTARADLSGLSAAGTELQTTMLPALAQQMGMTPAQLQAYIGTQFPDVTAGMQALPQITTTFNGLVTSLDEQQPLFRSADAIPTESLPATTVPWSIAVAGGVLVLVGVAIWRRPRFGAALALGLGVVLVVLPLALSTPQRAGDADDLNANLEPIYTASLVAQAQGALTTIQAMGTELQSEMLPALAQRLQMTPAQLQQMMVTSFPATTAALQDLPEAMPRFDLMVSAFEDNLDNYDVLKPVGFARIIWAVMALGLATAVVGAVMLFWPRHRVVSVKVR